MCVEYCVNVVNVEAIEILPSGEEGNVKRAEKDDAIGIGRYS